MCKRSLLIFDRDEGGQACRWRFWGYDWEKEGSCGHVHQLQWDPDGLCVLPFCRLVVNFQGYAFVSVTYFFTKIHANALLTL